MEVPKERRVGEGGGGRDNLVVDVEREKGEKTDKKSGGDDDDEKNENEGVGGAGAAADGPESANGGRLDG